MSNTQSHLIVKEEGICIYRVPDEPPKCYNTCAQDNMEGCSDPNSCLPWTDKYSDWKEAVKQAQSSATLCEDQERATQIILNIEQRNLASDGEKLNIKMCIGSIYPVPGIEFDPVEKKCDAFVCEINSKCCYRKMLDKSTGEPLTGCLTKTVARLIEHTAEKESPEIDKEQDELLNFLKWFNEGRWYKDMETFNWRRNFAYKEPEILTSEELVKLYRTPVNIKP